MLLRPDGPLDVDARDGGTTVLRDARLALAEPACYPEREGSAGTALTGAPLRRTAGGLVTQEGVFDGGAVSGAPSAVDCVADTGTRAVVVGDGTVTTLAPDGTTASGFPAVDGEGAVTEQYFWPNPSSGVDFFDVGVEFTEAYLVVPFTREGERGRPLGVYVERRTLDDTSATAAERAILKKFGAERIRVRVEVNEQTSHVEVYKRVPYVNFDPSVAIDPDDTGPEPAAQVEDPGLQGLGYHFVDRVQATGGPAGTYGAVSVGGYYVEWADETLFIQPDAAHAYAITTGLIGADGRVRGKGRAANYVEVPGSDPYSPESVAPAASGTVAFPAAGIDFEADRAVAFGGRVFYGGPRWRTAVPSVSTGPVATNTYFRFEYDDGGEAVVGPEVEGSPTDTTSGAIYVAPDPSAVALRVYHDDGAVHQLYERITPNAAGEWVSTYGAGALKGAAFAGTIDTGLYQGAETLTEVATVHEPLTVLVGAPFRPREVQFGEQFVLPDGSEIRALFPARLAEAEGIRAYSVYAASDTGVWAVTREGEGTYVLDPVSTTWGVALSAATGEPLVALVGGGAVVFGTDGHLHALSGRQARRLDTPVQGLWGSVLGMAYDPRPSGATLPDGRDVGPLLWALVTDAAGAPGSDASFGGTGKSLYGLAFGPERPAGWVAHRAVPADTEAVFYDDPELGGEGLLVVAADASGRDVVVVDGSGATRTGLWASGRVSTDAEVHVPTATLDIDSGAYDVTETAVVRAGWRHPSVVDVGEVASPGQITREAEVAHGRPFAARVRGRSVRFSASGFSALRSLDAEVREG